MKVPIRVIILCKCVGVILFCLIAYTFLCTNYVAYCTKNKKYQHDYEIFLFKVYSVIFK